MNSEIAGKNEKGCKVEQKKNGEKRLEGQNWILTNWRSFGELCLLHICGAVGLLLQKMIARA